MDSSYRPDLRFACGFAAHVLLLVAALAALGWSILTPDMAAVRIVTSFAALTSLWLLWRHVERGNAALWRFVEAIRFDDMQARFTATAEPPGKLAAALDAALAGLRRSRSQLGETARFNAALVEDIPIALLTLDPEHRVTLINTAARKVFCLHTGIRLSQFACYGGQFLSALTDLAPGNSRVISLSLDEGAQRAIVRAGTLQQSGGPVRVMTVQIIQQALNAAELATQNDLVRVITHEIMNSLTPITSLAGTAARLVAQVDQEEDPNLADLRGAIATLSRRTDGIMRFVETYRETTRPPKICYERFPATAFVEDCRRLFEAENVCPQLRLNLSVAAAHLIEADRELLMQVIINLLRNGAQAVSRAKDPSLSMAIIRLRSGKTKILIDDNGPGIPENIREDVFLPFFTTRSDGTGIGLALARQVILAHQGSIEIQDKKEAGMRICVVV